MMTMTMIGLGLSAASKLFCDAVVYVFDCTEFVSSFRSHVANCRRRQRCERIRLTLQFVPINQSINQSMD